MAETFSKGGPAIPRISVVIPAFNVEKYIEQTLDSIKRQTYQPYEVILVNDCSTDSTFQTAYAWSIKNKYPISFRKNNSNRGIGYTRSVGASFCNGDYITFLSADDCWHPDFLASASLLLAENIIVFSDYYQCDQNLEPYSIFKKPDGNINLGIIKFALEKNMFVNFSCTVFPKNVFAKCKFQDDLKHGEDLIFLLDTLINKFEYSHISKPLLYYRIHPQQGSNIRAVDEWKQLWLYIKQRLMIIGTPEVKIEQAMDKNYRILYPAKTFAYSTRQFLSKQLSKNKYGLSVKKLLKRHA